MKNEDALVFIDANQYLDLYRFPIKKSKKVLDLLREQQDYIFVTAQVVDEVQRRKLRVAEGFLVGQLNQLPNWSAVTVLTDYVVSVSGKPTLTLREKLRAVSQDKKVKTELEEAVVKTLQLISLSEDQVSKVLEHLFSKAIDHTPEEIERARKRKERGNPPGKQAAPLGDQLTWEQLLSHFQGKSRLWIISRDSDYFSKQYGKTFLNPLLYQDLARLNQRAPEAFCFDSISEGINDFVQKTGVKAKKLLTPEESQEIKKAQDALPPLDSLGWLYSGTDDATVAAIQQNIRSRQMSPALLAAISNQGWHPGMEPDPDKP
jgi:hypothetical protein